MEMSDSKGKGLHSYYGATGVGDYGGYNYNSAVGYGYPAAQVGGYPHPPVAYPYPAPYLQPQAACLSHHHHSGLGTLSGAVAGYMMLHSHGHAHGGYVAHGGHYGSCGYGRCRCHCHHGKFKHGKFGMHRYGGFRKWK